MEKLLKEIAADILRDQKTTYSDEAIFTAIDWVMSMIDLKELLNSNLDEVELKLEYLEDRYFNLSTLEEDDVMLAVIAAFRFTLKTLIQTDE